MKTGFQRMSVFVAAMLLAACAAVNVGKDFDLRAFETKAERGVTTQNQVRGWLGEPTGTGMAIESSGERLDEWTYFVARGELPDMKQLEMKSLQLRFDRNGVLRSYNYTSNRK